MNLLKVIEDQLNAKGLKSQEKPHYNLSQKYLLVVKRKKTKKMKQKKHVEITVASNRSLQM